MKKFSFALVVLTVFLNSAIQAFPPFKSDQDVVFARRVTVAKGELVELDRLEHEIGMSLKKQLVQKLYQIESAKYAEFELREETEPPCVTEPCMPAMMSVVTHKFTTDPKYADSQSLYQIGAAQDTCGSTIYHLVEKVEPAQRENARMLHVTDHTTRNCRDIKKYDWDVRLSHTTTPRRFAGNKD